MAIRPKTGLKGATGKDMISLNSDHIALFRTLNQRNIWDEYKDPKVRFKELWNAGYRGYDLQRQRKEPKKGNY